MEFAETLKELKNVERLKTLTHEDELLFLYKTVGLLRNRKKVRILECGTFSGVSAMIMAQAIINFNMDAHIDTVDDYSGADNNADTIREVISRKGYGAIVTVVESDDITFINAAQDEYYDLIFVDSLHKYQHVLASLHALLPKMAPLSFILGHDYCLAEPGVMKAVDEWRKVHNDTCVGFGLTGRIWWTAIRKEGL